MQIEQFLESTFSTAISDIVDLYQAATFSTEVAIEAIKFYKSDCGKNCSKIVFHNFNSMGAQNYREYDIKNEPHKKVSLMGPFMYKDSTKALPDTNLEAVNSPSIDYRTVDKFINPQPGWFMVNVMAIFSNKEVLNRYFEGVTFVPEKNQEFVNNSLKLVDNTAAIKEAIKANTESTTRHIIIARNLFDPAIINKQGISWLITISNLIETLRNNYPNIKLICLNLPDERTPSSVQNHIFDLAYKENLDHVEGDIKKRIFRDTFSELDHSKCNLTKDHLLQFEAEAYTNPLVFQAFKKACSRAKQLATGSSAKLNIAYIIQNNIAPAMTNRVIKIKESKTPRKKAYISFVIDALNMLADCLDDIIAAKLEAMNIKSITSNRGTLIGLNNFMSTIKSLKYILDYPEQAKKVNLTFPSGLMLIGKPGVGKTLAIEFIRDELNLKAYSFNYEGMLSSEFGVTDKNIANFLERISISGGIIFIDEAEKLFGNEDSRHDVTQRNISYLLTWIEKQEDLNRQRIVSGEVPVMIVLSCNNPLGFTDEFLRRMKYKFLFESPGKKARKKFIESMSIYFNNPISDIKQLDTLADCSEGLTCADIKTIFDHYFTINFMKINAEELTITEIVNGISTRLNSCSAGKSNRSLDLYTSSEFINWMSTHNVLSASGTDLDENTESLSMTPHLIS